MARYVIFAADQMYKGLHGMFDIFIDEYDSDFGATIDAENASLEVINSYGCITECLDEDASESITEDMFDDEISNVYWDVYQEDIYYEFKEIDEDKAKDIPTRQLERIAYDIGYEEFVEKYC